MDRQAEANERLIRELNQEFFLSLMARRDRKETLKNGEDMDMYLCREIFPVLVPGLESLSKEIERYMREGKQIDYRIRSRFNPCRWLAQFLMRNHPKCNPDSEIAKDYETERYVLAAKDILDS